LHRAGEGAQPGRWLEVTADAAGLTGRARLGLVAATAKAIGLASALSEAAGGGGPAVGQGGLGAGLR